MTRIIAQEALEGNAVPGTPGRRGASPFLVGTSRCDVPARDERAERCGEDDSCRPLVAPRCGADGAARQCHSVIQGLRILRVAGFVHEKVLVILGQALRRWRTP